jgi:LEA14-like dessication related protein
MRAPVFVHRLVAVAWLLLVAGCAALSALDTPPRVSLVALEPVHMELFEQRFRARLRIQNPNDRPLGVRGMDYSLEINGHTFADGVHAKAFSVPPYGEAVVDVALTSNLARVFEQFRALQGRSRPLFRYALRGGISLDGVIGKVGFSTEGEIDLGGGRSGGDAGTKT